MTPVFVAYDLEEHLDPQDMALFDHFGCLLDGM
jgi:hypothetical protein